METFLEAYNKHILSSLEYIAKIVRKHRSVSISTAIALATVSYVYYKLTTPPKHMRHIPKGDSIKLLRAIASGWTATEIAKKIQIPAAMQAEHGLYTVGRSSNLNLIQQKKSITRLIWLIDGRS